MVSVEVRNDGSGRPALPGIKRINTVRLSGRAPNWPFQLWAPDVGHAIRVVVALSAVLALTRLGIGVYTMPTTRQSDVAATRASAAIPPEKLVQYGESSSTQSARPADSLGAGRVERARRLVPLCGCGQQVQEPGEHR